MLTAGWLMASSISATIHYRSPQRVPNCPIWAGCLVNNRFSLTLLTLIPFKKYKYTREERVIGLSSLWESHAFMPWCINVWWLLPEIVAHIFASGEQELGLQTLRMLWNMAFYSGSGNRSLPMRSLLSVASVVWKAFAWMWWGCNPFLSGFRLTRSIT